MPPTHGCCKDLDKNESTSGSKLVVAVAIFRLAVQKLETLWMNDATAGAGPLNDSRLPLHHGCRMSLRRQLFNDL
jgi:hypothetical protein